MSLFQYLFLGSRSKNTRTRAPTPREPPADPPRPRNARNAHGTQHADRHQRSRRRLGRDAPFDDRRRPSGATIDFSNQLQGHTIVLTGGQLVINKNLDIEGPPLNYDWPEGAFFCETSLAP